MSFLGRREDGIGLPEGVEAQRRFVRSRGSSDVSSRPHSFLQDIVMCFRALLFEGLGYFPLGQHILFRSPCRRLGESVEWSEVCGNLKGISMSQTDTHISRFLSPGFVLLGEKSVFAIMYYAPKKNMALDFHVWSRNQSKALLSSVFFPARGTWHLVPWARKSRTQIARIYGSSTSQSVVLMT